MSKEALIALKIEGRYLCDLWPSGQFPGEHVRFLYLSENDSDLHGECLCSIYSHGLVVLGPGSGDVSKQVQCASLDEAQRYVQALVDLGEL